LECFLKLAPVLAMKDTCFCFVHRGAYTVCESICLAKYCQQKCNFNLTEYLCSIWWQIQVKEKS